MKTYKIYPIKVGEFYLDQSSLCYATNPGKKILSPVLIFLICGEDKEMFLVDTGCCDEENAKKYHMQVKYDKNGDVVSKLREMGINPEDIKVVINTHLHWDHCYNNGEFKDAKIYVQKKELEFAKNPLPCQCIAYESRKISLVPPWERIEDNFEIIDGDYTLAEGIELIFLPGHTPGSMGVSVNTEKGKYLIAGDLIQSNIVFDEMPCGLPKPSGVHINLEEYYESLKKVMKYGDYILPSHDFKVLENLVYPPKI